MSLVLYSAPRLNGQRLCNNFLAIKIGFADYPGKFDVNWSVGILQKWPIKRDGHLTEGCLMRTYIFW